MKIMNSSAMFMSPSFDHSPRSTREDDPDDCESAGGRGVDGAGPGGDNGAGPNDDDDEAPASVCAPKLQRVVPGSGELLQEEEDSAGWGGDSVSYRPCAAAIDEETGTVVIGWTWRTAFVYRLYGDGRGWAKESKIVLPLEQHPTVRCVVPAVSGDTVALGVPYLLMTDPSPSDHEYHEVNGAVFVYERNSEDRTWNFRQQLLPTRTDSYMYGSRVELSSDFLVVSGPQQAVDVFVRDGPDQSSTWSKSSELPGKGEGGGPFALHGRRIIVAGCERSPPDPSEPGPAACVYNFEGGLWALEATLDSRDMLPVVALDIAEDIAVTLDRAGTVSVFTRCTHWVGSDEKLFGLAQNIETSLTGDIAVSSNAHRQIVVSSDGFEGIARVYRSDENEDGNVCYPLYKVRKTINATEEANGRCCRGNGRVSPNAVIFGDNDMNERKNHYTVHYLYTLGRLSSTKDLPAPVNASGLGGAMAAVSILLLCSYFIWKQVRRPDYHELSNEDEKGEIELRA